MTRKKWLGAVSNRESLSTLEVSPPLTPSRSLQCFVADGTLVCVIFVIVRQVGNS